MSYVEKNLLPDEKIYFRTKKHYIIFMIPFLAMLVALFFCTENPVTNTINHLFKATPAGNYINRLPIFIFTAIAIVTGIKQWLIYVTSDFVVTDKRIMMKQGFFDRHIYDTRLASIAHITIEQSLLGQLLNYGTIVINGYGGRSDAFIQIHAPGLFQKNVLAQLDKTTK